MKPEDMKEAFEKAMESGKEKEFFLEWISSEGLDDVNTREGWVQVTDRDGDKHGIPLRLYIMLCMAYDGGAVMESADFKKYQKAVTAVFKKTNEDLKFVGRWIDTYARSISVALWITAIATSIIAWSYIDSDWKWTTSVWNAIQNNVSEAFSLPD